MLFVFFCTWKSKRESDTQSCVWLICNCLLMYWWTHCSRQTTNATTSISFHCNVLNRTEFSLSDALQTNGKTKYRPAPHDTHSLFIYFLRMCYRHESMRSLLFVSLAPAPSDTNTNATCMNHADNRSRKQYISVLCMRFIYIYIQNNVMVRHRICHMNRSLHSAKPCDLTEKIACGNWNDSQAILLIWVSVCIHCISNNY